MLPIEQFEKECYERPHEPYSSENLKQWFKILEWQEKYIAWIEKKIQNTSKD